MNDDCFKLESYKVVSRSFYNGASMLTLTRSTFQGGSTKLNTGLWDAMDNEMFISDDDPRIAAAKFLARRI